MNEAGEFSQLVEAVLARFLAQNGRAGLTTEEGRAVGRRLGAVVAERGWPRALADGECGAPGGMSEAEVAPLVAAVLGAAGDEGLANAVKQLVKACLYPEFTVCRESYREAAGDGGCKRQELARVRGRVSGTHCVDCPHWVALTPEQHGAMLARAWRGRFRRCKQRPSGRKRRWEEATSLYRFLLSMCELAERFAGAPRFCIQVIRAAAANGCVITKMQRLLEVVKTTCSMPARSSLRFGA